MLKQMNALKCRTLGVMSSCHRPGMTNGNSRNDPFKWYWLECACALSAGKWPTIHMAFNGAVLDLCSGAVSEKIPQIFWPPLPAEYMIVFSGRTDAPEVRFVNRQTDRQTPTTVTLTAHARRGLTKYNTIRWGGSMWLRTVCKHNASVIK